MIEMSKGELREMKWRENNGDLAELMTSEVNKIRSLNNCVNYLMVKGYFPSEAIKLTCNTITLDDWENFFCYPNSITLL